MEVRFGEPLLSKLVTQLRCYRNAPRVVQDVFQVLQVYATLTPYAAFYSPASGSIRAVSIDSFLSSEYFLRPESIVPHEVRVLGIGGTIPIEYRSSTYHIPITILFPAYYPFEAPLPLVQPTEKMELKQPHPHVDGQGKCFLTYLSTWQPQGPNSSIFTLLELLRRSFSEIPPVRAKSDPVVISPTPSYPSSTFAQHKPHSLEDTRRTTLSADQKEAARAALLDITVPSTPPGGCAQGPGDGRSAPVYTQVNTIPLVPIRSPAVIEAERVAAKKRQLKQMIRERYVGMEKKVKEDIRILECQKRDLEGKTRKKLEESLQLHLTELEQVDMALQSLQQKYEKICKCIEERKHDVVDADEICTPKDPHKKQLLEVEADVLAIDDVLYQLFQAYHHEMLSFDLYQRQTRNWARRQFFSIALSRKIQDTLRARNGQSGFSSTLHFSSQEESKTGTDTPQPAEKSPYSSLYPL